MGITTSQSPPRGGEVPSENRGGDNEVRRISTRHIFLLERYKESSPMISVLNVIEPMSLNEANETYMMCHLYSHYAV